MKCRCKSGRNDERVVIQRRDVVREVLLVMTLTFLFLFLFFAVSIAVSITILLTLVKTA